MTGQLIVQVTALKVYTVNYIFWVSLEYQLDRKSMFFNAQWREKSVMVENSLKLR